MSLQLSDLARNADGSFPDIGAEDWERWISEHPEVLQSEMIEGNRIMSFGVKADDFLEPAPGSKIVPGAAKLEDEVITNRYLRSD